MPVISALIVSIIVGFVGVYNASITNAAENKSRDERIAALERSREIDSEKIDKIREDVAYIRGNLFRR